MDGQDAFVRGFISEFEKMAAGPGLPGLAAAKPGVKEMLVEFAKKHPYLTGGFAGYLLHGLLSGGES